MLSVSYSYEGGCIIVVVGVRMILQGNIITFGATGNALYNGWGPSFGFGWSKGQGFTHITGK